MAMIVRILSQQVIGYRQGGAQVWEEKRLLSDGTIETVYQIDTGPWQRTCPAFDVSRAEMDKRLGRQAPHE